MALDPSQVVGPELLALCRTLAQSRLASAYYLAGGTALALQLGHRRSVDLDWFRRSADERVPAQSIGRELERLFGAPEVQLVRREIDQATWVVREARVTFLGYPFPLLHDLVPGVQVHESLRNLWLASPKEVALMKAYALGRRATFRDYVDLYFLLKDGLTTLDEIVEGASRKFVLQGRPLFSVRLFLEQLVYLSDIEDIDATLRLLQRPVTPGEVEKFFRDLVTSFVRNQAKGGVSP